MNHHGTVTVCSIERGEEISSRRTAPHAEAEHTAPWRTFQVIKPWKVGGVHRSKALAKVVHGVADKTDHAFGIKTLSEIDQGGFFGFFRGVHDASSEAGESTAMWGRASHSSSSLTKRPFRPT